MGSLTRNFSVWSFCGSLAASYLVLYHLSFTHSYPESTALVPGSLSCANLPGVREDLLATDTSGMDSN